MYLCIIYKYKLYYSGTTRGGFGGHKPFEVSYFYNYNHTNYTKQKIKNRHKTHFQKKLVATLSIHFNS